MTALALALFGFILHLDPLLTKQWALLEIGTPFAWGESSGDGVTVAVLDAGFALNHPDLEISDGWNIPSRNTDISPIGPHGTWILGALAAVAGNGVGISGVAPRVRVIPVRVTNRADGAAYVQDIAEGIYYAADHGADIVLAGYAVTEHQAIHDAAANLGARGGVLVVPAGNGGWRDNTSDSDDILSVGAIDINGYVPEWSARGDHVDLVAPGVGVLTTAPLGRYQYVSGTSMAAPIAAGALALVAGTHPEWTMSQCIDWMLGHARGDGEWSHDRGWGVVDLVEIRGSQ